MDATSERQTNERIANAPVQVRSAKQQCFLEGLMISRGTNHAFNTSGKAQFVNSGSNLVVYVLTDATIVSRLEKK